MENGTTMADYYRIEKIDSLTDALKDELIEVRGKSVRSSHHFLSEEDLMDYLEKEPLDVLVTFGAGNISDYIEPITEMLRKRVNE